jgi:hypothetical protein
MKEKEGKPNLNSLTNFQKTKDQESIQHTSKEGNKTKTKNLSSL